MPIKLIFSTLGVLLFVALSVYEAWTEVPDPMDGLNIAVGVLFLVGVAAGRDWLRPMGVTLGGWLLFQSIWILFGMMGAGGGRGNMSRDYVTDFRVASYAFKLVLGALLIPCVYRHDVVAWIDRRGSARAS